MGLTLRQVRRVFLWQAGQIGLKGTLMGAALGLAICGWLLFFPYRLPSSYYIEFLPVAVEPLALVLMIAVGPVISLLAGLYPARQATRYGIAEVLRYE